LIPKKAKDFRKQTAEDTGYSKDLVNSFLDFYWERVRKELSDLVYPKILIPGLGTFRIKHWKLDETKEHYEQILNRVEGNFHKYAMFKDITDKVQKIEAIKNELLKEKIRLDNKKTLRKNESIKNNMDEEVSDMGGIQEQNIQEKQNRETVQGENGDM
jgi:hypothetical protein